MVISYKDTNRPCGNCHSGTFVLYGDEEVARCRYCGVLDAAKGEPTKRSISPATAKKVTNE